MTNLREVRLREKAAHREKYAERGVLAVNVDSCPCAYVGRHRAAFPFMYGYSPYYVGRHRR